MVDETRKNEIEVLNHELAMRRQISWHEDITEKVLESGAKATIAMLELEMKYITERMMFIKKILKKIRPNKVSAENNNEQVEGPSNE